VRVLIACFAALAAASWLAGTGVAAAAGKSLPNHPPSDPVALARELNRAQQVIGDAEATMPALQAAGHFEQLAFRELANSRPLRAPTLAHLTFAARSVASSAIRAADAIVSINPPAPRFPDWHILAPPAPDTLLGYFQAAERRYSIPWRYLAAVEFVETRMGRIHGGSPAGAQGPMQFMRSTWALYGSGSIDSQRDSIMAAAHYLAANGGRGDIAAALFHYNPSNSYVVAVEVYADAIRRDARAFYGFYSWQVLYRTVKGVYVLPVGYPRLRPQRLPD
jgi:hypothetical protein